MRQPCQSPESSRQDLIEIVEAEVRRRGGNPKPGKPFDHQVTLFLDGREAMKTKIGGDAEKLWSVEDVAEYLAMPVQAVREMVSERYIPHLSIREHLRFRRSGIDRWLDLLVVPCRSQAVRTVSPSLDNSAVSLQYGNRSPAVPLSVAAATPQVLTPTSRSLPPALPQAAKMFPAVRAPLGRRGPEYLYLQELVKRMGEAHGFRVTIEQPLLEGQGCVDVALEWEEWRLACEIPETSAVHQEVGKVQKCLAASFDAVAVVLPGRRQIEKIRKALAKELTQEDFIRVRLLTPEELPFYFDELPARGEEVQIIRGYKVRVRYEQTDPADQERRGRAVAEVIAKSLLRMKKAGL